MIHARDQEVLEFVRQGIEGPEFMRCEVRERMWGAYYWMVATATMGQLQEFRKRGVMGFSLLELTTEETRKIIEAEVAWMLPGMVTRFPEQISRSFGGLHISAGLRRAYDFHHTKQHFEDENPSAEVVGQSVDRDWWLVRKKDPIGILEEDRASGARNAVMFSDRPHASKEDYLDSDVVDAPALLPAEYHILLDARAKFFKRMRLGVMGSRTEVAEPLVSLGLIKLERPQDRSRSVHAWEIRLTDLGLRFCGISDKQRRTFER
ncbi:hypothetical protein HOU02_gp406 [Caulobacter phage CcrBL9]|uniref:Uncharacterized protein n=1 Tax=Caulobacter phage CcrBL9 TaxID=2283270 RepID=A0A385EF59_9CAUD|nr:hypothetical protein HOU02_gp406 [Caulobacter phage CcrBL9]AXQ69319.1 hypothetical protein CcrBL9_gp295 [Caulobacter phage CcrBL9]